MDFNSDASVSTQGVATPNEPKLSDRRGGRDSCAGSPHETATNVSEATRESAAFNKELAASVTAPPVRSSALLGVFAGNLEKV